MGLKIGILMLVVGITMVGIMASSVSAIIGEVAYCSSNVHVTNTIEIPGTTINLWGGDNCKLYDPLNWNGACTYRVYDCPYHAWKENSKINGCDGNIVHDMFLYC